MVHVTLTRHLVRKAEVPPSCQADGRTVAELVRDLDRQFPGLAAYVTDERGALRQHVNIFIGDQLVRDRAALSDPVDTNAEVTVMQALSGG